MNTSLASGSSVPIGFRSFADEKADASTVINGPQEMSFAENEGGTTLQDI